MYFWSGGRGDEQPSRMPYETSLFRKQILHPPVLASKEVDEPPDIQAISWQKEKTAGVHSVDWNPPEASQPPVSTKKASNLQCHS
jgi:hypothetical protein